MTPSSSAGHARSAFVPAAYVLAFMAIVRLATLGLPPLIDPSETRFAASAQEMLYSGDFITPRISQGVLGWQPYWAKPPLHMWLTAAALALFGEHSAAARLPALLSNFLTVFLIGVAGARLFGRATGWGAALLLASSLGFFGFAFICLTDPELTLTTTGCLCSFALFAKTREDGRPGRGWGYAVFAAAGAGMLVKGPVALALPGLPIAAWIVLERRWRDLRALPWLLGLPLFAALWLPWFIAAERATPGFLEYFFLRENFARFLVKKAAFRYGTAHTHPYGMVLLMAAGTFFPWTLALFGLLWKRTKTHRAAAGHNPWLRLAALWFVCPLLFFSFVPQVLPTYTFPALPGLALFTAALLFEQSADDERRLRMTAKGALVLAAAASIALVLLTPHVAARRSIAPMLDEVALRGAGREALRLGILCGDPHGARFFGRGRSSPRLEITTTLDPAGLNPGAYDFLLIKEGDIPKELRSHALVAIGAWYLYSPDTSFESIVRDPQRCKGERHAEVDEPLS